MQETPENSLESFIPPEISGDRFHAAISWLCEHEGLHSVLEIGSSAGGGSTTAFVEGLLRNSGRPTLYCMEVSTPRFERLKQAYSAFEFVKCYNASSVRLEEFPSEAEVSAFYHSHQTALNQWPLERVLGWLRRDLDYLATSEVPQGGIRLIKEESKIENFDLVLIDGSEFSGSVELREVHGATIICLDDTRTFKNFLSRRDLLQDPLYQVLVDDQALRNGFAIFCRRDKPCEWRALNMYLHASGRVAARRSPVQRLWSALRRAE